MRILNESVGMINQRRCGREWMGVDFQKTCIDLASLISARSDTFIAIMDIGRKMNCDINKFYCKEELAGMFFSFYILHP